MLIFDNDVFTYRVTQLFGEDEREIEITFQALGGFVDDLIHAALKSPSGTAEGANGAVVVTIK